MSKRAALAGMLAFCALGVIGVILALGGGGASPDAPRRARAGPLAGLVIADDAGFARIQHPWRFQFPADHGPHDAFRTEWWYVTGTVADRRGQHLGLQVVLLRLGLAADPPERASRWGASQVYAGLFSISDPAGTGLHTAQRASRAALGLGGAKALPMQVWVDSWQVAQLASSEQPLDREVRITDAEMTLNLVLRNRKPLLDGNAIRGQGAEGPAALHLYVQPRLRAEGTLQIGGEQKPVAGIVSLEHAWGELPLPGGPVALDRFTLHLDDGRELFCVRSHRIDGSGEPSTTGMLVDENNRARLLSSDHITLRPTGYWHSARTGARYPVRWLLRVPTQGIEGTLLPHWEDQEGFGWTPFWAGPVHLRAPAPAPGRLGNGFVQLNGYQGT